MAPYYGNLIDGDGATEESVGRLDPETQAIVDADLKIKPEDRTVFDDQRDAAYEEYQEDMARLTENMNKALEKAQKELESGNMDRYNTAMESADRYGRLMEIEGRLLELGLSNVNRREGNVPSETSVNDTSINNVKKEIPKEPKENKPSSTPPSSGSSNQTTPSAPVRIPEVSVIQFKSDAVPEGLMEYLIFEKIGGHEIINMVRSDSVNGQNIIYSPIANLSLLLQEYNPNNILGLQLTSDKFFENFNIVLETRVPEVGNGLNGANVYLDSITYDLIVETVNSFEDESVETQILTSGTIYETILEEYTI